MVDHGAWNEDEKSTHVLARFDPTELPETSFVLTVLDGPSAGTRIELDGTQPAPVLIGQSSVCALRLADPMASRRHAALDFAGDHLRLSDLGSTNGTRVNGVRVVEAMLHGGEMVSIGRSTIVIERGRDTSEIELSTATRFGRMVGMSSEMRRLYPLCERLAVTDIPVLIEGETGTGKEILAESLHELGPRAGGPFVVFDCTAVPANLLESELFGHSQGAFTGASFPRRGLVEEAHGGTLLIDEIGDLDIALQAKLLRVIERKEFRPVGSNEVRRVDVRVLAATRRDLDREIQAGRFRDDLFHRLAVGRIELPPLRRRRGDVPVLVAYLLEQMGAERHAVPASVMARWQDHAWPGNVRELSNAVARHVALGKLAASTTAPSVLPPDADVVAHTLSLELPYTEARDRVVREFSKRYVALALDRHGGNVTRAAESSGIGRRYFQMLRHKGGE